MIPDESIGITAEIIDVEIDRLLLLRECNRSAISRVIQYAVDDLGCYRMVAVDRYVVVETDCPRSSYIAAANPIASDQKINRTRESGRRYGVGPLADSSCYGARILTLRRSG